MAGVGTRSARESADLAWRDDPGVELACRWRGAKGDLAIRKGLDRGCFARRQVDGPRRPLEHASAVANGPGIKAVRQNSRLARDSYGADFSAACVERDALGLFQLAQLKTDVAPPG